MFQKVGVYQIIHLNAIFSCKPSALGATILFQEFSMYSILVYGCFRMEPCRLSPGCPDIPTKFLKSSNLETDPCGIRLVRFWYPASNKPVSYIVGCISHEVCLVDSGWWCSDDFPVILPATAQTHRWVTCLCSACFRRGSCWAGGTWDT